VPSSKRPDQVIYYQFRANRARRTPRNTTSITNPAAGRNGSPVTADFVISSYHQPWNI